MLDIRFVRDNLEMVKQAMQDLQALDVPLDAALALDDERRKVLTELETLRARRNTDSRRIGQLLREGQHEAAATLKAELAALPNGIAALEERLAQIDPALRDAWLRIPNLPLPQVPVGKDESENIVTRVEGQPRAFDFSPRPHWEIGEALGILVVMSRKPIERVAYWHSMLDIFGTGHPGLRARRQALRLALLRAEGPGRPPAARVD